MKKQEQILKLLSEDVNVGDLVKITYTYKEEISVYGKWKNKNKVIEVTYEDRVYSEYGEVSKVDGDIVIVKTNSTTRVPSGIEYSFNGAYTKLISVDKKYVKKDVRVCGANPFSPDVSRIDFYNIDIESLLSRCGYSITRNSELYTNKIENKNDVISSRGASFNPFIIDSNGDMVFYQRDYVWDIKDKQLLIESIYNGIEIGKFLFRYNSWSRIEKYKGEVFSFDCVDGKQRLNAIIEFIDNKFTDLHGNYWNDLSVAAQSKFLNYGNMSYGQLAEDASDKEVLNCFLKLNFSGKVMSMEHIEFVKSIKL